MELDKVIQNVVDGEADDDEDEDEVVLMDD